MTRVEDLPDLPSRETLAAGLPWTAQRMSRQAEPFGEGIHATVIALLQFLYQCAGMEWADPREAKEQAPEPKDLMAYRRWLIPMVREMATANSWCFAAPDITRAMFQETGVDVYEVDGFDILGLDREGYNRYGFDTTGKHRDGRMRSSGLNVVQEKYEREDGEEPVYVRPAPGEVALNESGYDVEGFDKEGFDEKGYNREGLDRWGNRQSDVEPLHWRRIVNKYQPSFPAEKPREVVPVVEEPVEVEPVIKPVEETP